MVLYRLTKKKEKKKEIMGSGYIVTYSQSEVLYTEFDSILITFKLPII